MLNYLGLNARMIEYVVDRNTHKHGKYMPGVRRADRRPGAADERPPGLRDDPALELPRRDHPAAAGLPARRRALRRADPRPRASYRNEPRGPACPACGGAHLAETLPAGAHPGAELRAARQPGGGARPSRRRRSSSQFCDACGFIFNAALRARGSSTTVDDRGEPALLRHLQPLRGGPGGRDRRDATTSAEGRPSRSAAARASSSASWWRRPEPGASASTPGSSPSGSVANGHEIRFLREYFDPASIPVPARLRRLPPHAGAHPRGGALPRRHRRGDRRPRRRRHLLRDPGRRARAARRRVLGHLLRALLVLHARLARAAVPPGGHAGDRPPSRLRRPVHHPVRRARAGSPPCPRRTTSSGCARWPGPSPSASAERRAHWRGFVQRRHQEGARVAIWGGGSKGVAFLTTNGLRDEVAQVVDINPHKQGKFLPVTRPRGDRARRRLTSDAARHRDRHEPDLPARDRRRPGGARPRARARRGMSLDTCPLCSAADPEPVFALAGVPVLCNQLWPDAASARAAPTGDLDLVVCRGCALIWNRAFDPARMDYGPGYENALHFSPKFRAFAEELGESLVAPSPARRPQRRRDRLRRRLHAGPDGSPRRRAGDGLRPEHGRARNALRRPPGREHRARVLPLRASRRQVRCDPLPARARAPRCPGAAPRRDPPRHRRARRCRSTSRSRTPAGCSTASRCGTSSTST